MKPRELAFSASVSASNSGVSTVGPAVFANTTALETSSVPGNAAANARLDADATVPGGGRYAST